MPRTPRTRASAADAGDRAPHRPRTVILTVGALAVVGATTALTGSSLLHPPASTEDGDYRDETLEVVIPLAEGGGTDTWARFTSQELAHAVPGDPGLQPVNEGGGEGILASNRFASSAEATGTELLVSTATTVVPWVLEHGAVAYSFEDLRPVLVNGTGGVIYARTDAGVTSAEDLVDRESPLVFGGIAATGLDVTTLLAFDLLGADVSATFGFEGRGPVNLALQRGEVDLDYTTTSSYEAAVAPLVEDGSAVVLASFGQLDADGEIVRDPNFPDVPTVAEVYEQLYGAPPEGAAYETYRALLGLTYTYQKGLWVPKETPDAAVELLRESAHEMSQDPGFTERAETILGGYPIVADETLEAKIEAAYGVSDEVKAYIRDLLADEYDTTVH